MYYPLPFAQRLLFIDPHGDFVVPLLLKPASKSAIACLMAYMLVTLYVCMLRQQYFYSCRTVYEICIVPGMNNLYEFLDPSLCINILLTQAYDKDAVPVTEPARAHDVRHVEVRRDSGYQCHTPVILLMIYVI